MALIILGTITTTDPDGTTTETPYYELTHGTTIDEANAIIAEADANPEAEAEAEAEADAMVLAEADLETMERASESEWIADAEYGEFGFLGSTGNGGNNA